MTEAYRVLVTGSRTWQDEDAVYAALSAAQRHAAGRPLVIVHGDCENSPDRMADRWARVHGVPYGIVTEPHPANWRQHRKQAGFIRNAEMVSLGADLCLAFIAPCTKPSCHSREPHGSHGATHCAALAEKAGIEVRRFTMETVGT